jgi:DNA (cytosine-5)-methyltransferase 1
LSGAYYNENHKPTAQWLRNLIREGLIADGDVDDRSIEDIAPYELRKYTQCHFFAGIAVWSYALRQAGWSDDRRCHTGSPPCQPYSSAGSQLGFTDQRHLWPAWHHLIRELRPPTVFGEQVEKAIGFGWLDLVQADMENEDYAFGAAVLPAASVSAPHIRSRLLFVAHSRRERREGSFNRGGISLRHEKKDPECGDPFAIARRTMAGDFSDLLLNDGTTSGMERMRIHAYGNAIVAPMATQFVKSYMAIE